METLQVRTPSRSAFYLEFAAQFCWEIKMASKYSTPGETSTAYMCAYTLGILAEFGTGPE